MTASDTETLRLARAAVDAFSRGDGASAQAHANAALARNGAEPNALQVLGLLALQSGAPGVARGYLERAAAAAPDQPAILNALGGALRQTGDVAGARSAFTRAGEKGSGEAWRNLGHLEAAEGALDAALAAYERTLRLNAGDVGAHASLARLLERRRDFTRAQAHAEQALARDPNNDIARLTLAQLALGANDYAHAEAIAALVAEGRAPKTNQALAWGLIGEARDKAKRPREAFEAFSRSNALLNEMHGGLRGDTRSPFHLESIARVSALAAQAPPRAASLSGPAPVFLIGFPRSGTTLLDQILSGHPEIVAMEEKDVLASLLAGATQSDASLNAFAAAPPDMLAAVRDAYWEGVTAAGVAPGRRTFVDKLPLNLVLWPLLRRVFPDAKIILALRDPRDVILSCYQQRFGMNVAMAHLLDLQTAAEYYAATMRLADACRAHEGENLHVVRYEDVVADLEGQSRALTHFLGLGFDAAMLDFTRTAARRDINTPSARQVTQPLYASSVGRWRAYAEQLAPVVPVLEPWVRRFGYSP